MIDVKMIKKFFVLLFVTFCLVLSACGDAEPTGHIKTQDGTAKLSLSSDGRYVITSTLHKKLFLFDIKNKTKKLLSNDANIYSAYFIKKSHNFLWQDVKNNTVYVENVHGKIVKQFNPGFPTYGQVMSTDLKTYVAADNDSKLYVLKNQKATSLNINGGYESLGKLLNLHLSSNGSQLLTSGGFDDMQFSNAIPIKGSKTNYPADSVVLWDLDAMKPIFGFPGNISKTYATFSANEKFILSTDESMQLLSWFAQTGKMNWKAYSIYFGKFIKNSTEGNEWDESVLKVKPPADYHSPDNIARWSDSLAIMNISKDKFFRVIENIPYVILYSLSSPAPLKYLKLDDKPYPSINDYSRDQSIDSSWQTYTFVTGHAIGDGITVYKYNPKNQTLNMVWISK